MALNCWIRLKCSHSTLKIHLTLCLAVGSAAVIRCLQNGLMGRWEASGQATCLWTPPMGPGCCGPAVWDTELTSKGLRPNLQIITQIWPYLSMIMENKIREKLEPKIREKSVHLRTFTFTKLYFGQKVSDASERSAWTSWAVFSCLSFWSPPLRTVLGYEDATGPQRAIVPACVSQLVSPRAQLLPPVLLPNFPGSKETTVRKQKEAGGNSSSFLLETLETCTEGAR